MREPEEEWQDLCRQASVEQNPTRLMHLTRRIIELLDQKRHALVGRSTSQYPQTQSPPPNSVHRDSLLAESNPYLQFRTSPWIPDLLASTLVASAADFGTLQLFDSSDRLLRIVAQHGFGDEFLRHFEAVRSDDHCACGAAMNCRSRIFITDVATDPMFGDSDSRDMLLRARVRSVQSTPLIDPSGNFIGMVSTHYEHPTSLSPSVWKGVDELVAACMAEIQLEGLQALSRAHLSNTGNFS